MRASFTDKYYSSEPRTRFLGVPHSDNISCEQDVLALEKGRPHRKELKVCRSCMCLTETPYLPGSMRYYRYRYSVMLTGISIRIRILER